MKLFVEKYKNRNLKEENNVICRIIYLYTRILAYPHKI